MAWVYILRGASGRYYIGSTENLARRLAEHQRGSNHTTAVGAGPSVGRLPPTPHHDPARQLEQVLKRKKNPKLALHALLPKS